jgi:hypothetical protein
MNFQLPRFGRLGDLQNVGLVEIFEQDGFHAQISPDRARVAVAIALGPEICALSWEPLISTDIMRCPP